MLNRLTTPLVSLVLAVLAWLYMHGRSREFIDDYPVPVDVRLAPDQEERYLLEFPGPAQVHVSFSGPRSQMRKLRDMLRNGETRFQRVVRIPENRATESVVEETLRFEPSELSMPAGVRVDILNGWGKVSVVLRRVVERKLRVELRHTGTDRLEQLTVAPETVLVRGPKDVLERHVSIPTQLLVLPDGDSPPMKPGKPVKVPVETRLNGYAVHVTPTEVSVSYRVRATEKLYELSNVPVHFLCPASFPFRVDFPDPAAGEVAVKVRGPVASGQPAVMAYIDLTSRKLNPGLREKETVRVRLPPGYQLVQEPAPVNFRLVKP
jgi:hypothetical protein